jgi:membrane fusion protein, heavy metal efflux system
MKFKSKHIKETIKKKIFAQKKPWLLISFMAFITYFVSISLIAKPNDQATNAQHSVPTVVHEETLNTVLISDDSYKKLGIQTTKIKQNQITETKTYGGELVVPSGGVISVTAPISGKLISVDDSNIKPGASIKAGQLLYRIEPIITPDARVNLVNALADAESLVNVTKSQVEAAEITLNRAKKLLQDLVGSQRNVDEANAAHEIALRNLEAAKVKRNALHQVVNQGTLEPLEIRSPEAGFISNILAVNNQLLSAGNPVIEISNLNSLWLRVAIPTGDANTIDYAASAIMQASTIATIQSAKPINATPTADPLTNSIHLYYVVENSNVELRPGQRVSVRLKTLNKHSSALTIPWSAVVVDIYGGNWVYTQETKNSYKRQRVFIDHVDSNLAVISNGPSEGSDVVVNGALELFGVETGFTH